MIVIYALAFFLLAIEKYMANTDDNYIILTPIISLWLYSIMIYSVKQLLMIKPNVNFSISFSSLFSLIQTTIHLKQNYTGKMLPPK